MREYVSLDLETTGLEPKKDRIIEIGAAKIRDGEVQETYSLLVDPRIKIPERITDLTGINNQMVEGQPFVEEEGVLEFKHTTSEYDGYYDEIGADLKIKQLRREGQEFLEALELYYRVFFLGEDVEEPKA